MRSTARMVDGTHRWAFLAISKAKPIPDTLEVTFGRPFPIRGQPSFSLRRPGAPCGAWKWGGAASRSHWAALPVLETGVGSRGDDCPSGGDSRSKAPTRGECPGQLFPASGRLTQGIFRLSGVEIWSTWTRTRGLPRPLPREENPETPSRVSMAGERFPGRRSRR